MATQVSKILDLRCSSFPLGCTLHLALATKLQSLNKISSQTTLQYSLLTLTNLSHLFHYHNRRFLSAVIHGKKSRGLPVNPAIPFSYSLAATK